MRILRTLTLGVGLAALLSSAPVLAQGAAKKKAPAEQPSESDAEARRVFKEGDKLYAEGDYEGAVTAFEKAYELSKQPALKYNLANAYERLARYQEALDALKEYEPHAAPDERDVVRRRLKKLKERADQQQKEKAAGADKAAASEPAPPPAEEPVAPSEPAPTNAEVSTASPTPVLGYVLLGVGAVGIGAGSFFGIQALGSKSDIDKLCSDVNGSKRCSSAAEDKISQNKTSALIADVSFAVGIAAAAVGAYIVIKGSKPKETTSARLEAGAGPQGGQVSLVGTF
jgi:tetratricopeptide (TPR) repeat protein